MCATALPAEDNAPRAYLFLKRKLTQTELSLRTTKALYEPDVGCYLGAYIEFDANIKQMVRDYDGKLRRDYITFEKIVGKPHAIYFFYLGYGKEAPLGYIRMLAERGKFVHIALEPNDGLDKVKNDTYLVNLAKVLGKSGAKIFLRFASEMNGSWTNYNDPVKFRAKFRLVYQVMKKYAPNVAMVWCPFAFPAETIPSYYPGDDATDWVGVNLYSVTYHNNDLNQPSEDEHPVDLVATVYNRYAKRKPMMIGEFGASHYMDREKKLRIDFATRKIATLYAALPRVFPRIKAVHYFNSNALQFTEHAKNIYTVTDQPKVRDGYKIAIRPPYFLSEPMAEEVRTLEVPMAIRHGEILKGKVEISCFARTPGDKLRVVYKLDGHPIYEASHPSDWSCLWDAGSVRSGGHVLTLEVYDSKNRLKVKKSVIVVTGT